MKEAIAVDPVAILRTLASDLPLDLHDQVFVIGSLAAAGHHAKEVGRVKTKDADLVVYPSGNTSGAQQIALRLLGLGWRPTRTGNFPPGNVATPAKDLPAIRLYPPQHDDYFVELLILPEGEQAGTKDWLHVELDDGWYGLPSFEFLALTECHRQRLVGGLQYAHPSMMALANLLSHRVLGDEIMSSPVAGRPIRRHAKDLGRVLALVYLEPRPELDLWADRWLEALKDKFPSRWPELASSVGEGLRALLVAPTFEESVHCCAEGLLVGKGVSEAALRAIAKVLLADVIASVEQAGHRKASRVSVI